MRPLAERVADDTRADVDRLGGRMEVGGAWGVVDGDEVLLRQAISNLVRNAIEACGEAGRAPAIQLHGEVDRESRVLRVHVTEVQKIVVTHNGRVQALSGPGGRGTTMSITLPLASA